MKTLILAKSLGSMANALQVKAYPSYFDPTGHEINRWNGKFPDDLIEYASDQID